MSVPSRRPGCALAPTDDRGSEGRPPSTGATAAMLVAAWAVAWLWSPPALAQPIGIQDRADAASRMILLGVSQGINSLPPASGQSFNYEYDPQLDTFVASGQLGPAVFRSPRSIGPGKLSFRIATSYFELFDDLGTIPYRITGYADGLERFTRLGLEVEAEVGLLNLAVGYGVIDGLEVGLNVPITIVDANARNIAVYNAATGNFTAARTLEALDGFIRSGAAELRAEPFDVLPNTRFNEGTSVGLGQVGLSAKYSLLSFEGFELSPAFDLLLPSPSEDEFAGPDSVSLVPRALASFWFIPELAAHVDAGYNYTVEFRELSGFVWNAGLSGSPDKRVVLDVGVGGTYYAKGIEWTPDAFIQPGGTVVEEELTLQAEGENTLGRNYVDFLFGLKLQVTESSVLNGAVRVPLNDSEGFRPIAAGTIAYEVYF